MGAILKRWADRNKGGVRERPVKMVEWRYRYAWLKRGILYTGQHSFVKTRLAHQHSLGHEGPN